MDCNDCIERLYEFLDLELDEKDLSAMRAHVSGCDDCGDQLGFERRFLERLRECCTSDVAPAALRERVIEKLRGAGPPST
jgi:mycothiol system anti-sigma-R factor